MVAWVPIFLYSSILTSLRKENHLDIRRIMFPSLIILKTKMVLFNGALPLTKLSNPTSKLVNTQWITADPPPNVHFPKFLNSCP